MTWIEIRNIKAKYLEQLEKAQNTKNKKTAEKYRDKAQYFRRMIAEELIQWDFSGLDFKQLNVMAPGSSIYSTIPGSSYGYKSGTSMACPFASGLAAVVWGAAPDYTNVQVQQLIQDNAVDLGSPGWDQYYGYGRIDALATLQQFGQLIVSLTNMTFLADSQVGSIPDSVDIMVQTSVQSAGVISWTTVISPEATTWLSVAPNVGSVSGSMPASIRIEPDTNGLGYGTYNCELLIATISESKAFTSSVEISLNFVAELHRYFFVPILKNYNLD